MLDLILVPLEEREVTAAGGGIRTPPPKLQVVSEAHADVLESDLEAIEATELAQSDAAPELAGGGVRVPPPKLTTHAIAGSGGDLEAVRRTALAG